MPDFIDCDPIAAGNRYTDGSYLDSNSDWHLADSPWKANHIAAILKARKLSPHTICEIGCGAGGILASLQPSFPDAHFVGYDISPQAFQLALSRQNEKLRFFNADLLAGEAQQFDVVIAADVFEHVSDYIGFLKRLRQFGKHFVFHVPLDLSALSLMREWPILRRRHQVGHIHHFTRATAIATLQDAGYNILESKFTESGFVDPKTIKGRIRELPVRLLFKLAPVWTANFFGGFSLLVLAD